MKEKPLKPSGTLAQYTSLSMQFIFQTYLILTGRHDGLVKDGPPVCTKRDAFTGINDQQIIK